VLVPFIKRVHFKLKNRHFTYIIFIIFCALDIGFVQAQTISIVVGNGVPGYSGDGNMATAAQLFQPSSIAVDNSGNSYIVDNGNDNIRKVSASGIITTIAGDFHRKGLPGIEDVRPCYTHDGGPATGTIVWKPQGIAADHSGNIYFIEVCGGVRKIDADGTITTIASNRRLANYNVDSDLAANAMRYEPRKMVIDKDENIYYADEKANAVRKISKSGSISNVAGNGFQGYSGDGKPATAAALNGPWGVAVDNTGNVYINDRGNGRIRKVDAAGIITTIAGNGNEGYDGDGGPASSASFHDPRGIAADHYGNLYIADAENRAVRRIDADGIITTFVGGLRQPIHCLDVVVDNSNNVYIADDQHYVVRKVTVPPPLPKVQLQQPPADTAENFTITADIEKSEIIITTLNGAYAAYAITDMQNHDLIKGVITGTKTTADVSQLPTGSYYITLKKEKKEKTLRFMLDR
jgi:streptogramin lyase